VLGLRVTFGDLRRHVEQGGYGMIEVWPSAIQHFVLAIDYDERGFLVLDPLRGDKIYLTDRYQGIESVRLLHKTRHVERTTHHWPRWKIAALK
jgi:hypothetical protein